MTSLDICNQMQTHVRFGNLYLPSLTFCVLIRWCVVLVCMLKLRTILR